VEIGAVTGLVSAIIMLLTSVLLMGGSLEGMMDLPAMIIIGGGIVCGVLVAFPTKDCARIPAVFMRGFFPKTSDLIAVINQIVELAEMARRDGILTLDAKLQEIDNPFLVSGMRMVIDGMNHETVEAIMRREVNALNARHKVGKGMVSQLGKAAPVFGLVATLLGLVQMLANMDPKTIGHQMSVAILGTFYGAVSANLFFLPFGEKLKNYNQMELDNMEIIIVGVLAIQAGENPRVIKLKLTTFIPPKLRVAEKSEGES